MKISSEDRRRVRELIYKHEMEENEEEKKKIGNHLIGIQEKHLP